MSITTVDLFCGAGGFTEGFNKAGGFETLLAIDFDKQAIDTFKYNHPAVNAICADICDMQSSDILQLTKNRQVNVVIGGPPCQGFSLAGRRLPEDPKNKLFREYVRIVELLQPDYFIFENVLGIVSMQGGMVVEVICEEFGRLDYEVSHSVLNAADYGVPQARPRFILIGSKNGNRITMPPPTHDNAKNCGISDLFGNHLLPHVTVKDALSSLPMINQGEGAEEMEKPAPLNDYQKTIVGTRQFGLMFNHRATRHNNAIIERYNHMPMGGDIRSLPERLKTKKNNVFRLQESLPSRTITCNFRTDIIHPWVPRGLTSREAARLQSFDDDYRFFGNLTRKARYVTQDDQIGNAVPPLLAKALASHIKGLI